MSPVRTNACQIASTSTTASTGGTTLPLKLEGKYPGVQFSTTGKYQDRDTLLEGRLYLVDQRLYQIVALSRPGEIAQAVVNRYFNSFKLIPVEYTEKVQIKPPPVDKK